MSEPSAARSSGDQRDITRRAGLVAAGTLFSRVLGAVRDAVIAATFSLAATDAFFVAWTVPNTLRRLLGEGAVSAAFIPMFAELDETEGRVRARGYLASFAGVMLVLLSAVAALGVATAPLWAAVYAAGYRSDPEKFATTIELLTLTFPYILFAGLAALATGVLNAVGRFFVASFSPALLNVALISAPLLFVPLAASAGLTHIAGLAIAALAGGALQVLVQLPAMRKDALLPRPRFGFSDPAVRKSLALMAPLLLGTGVYQINILLSRLLASYLESGAQSYLYYGQRLVEIPQGMFAMAVASAALPSLSRLRNQGAHEEALATLRYSIQLTLFIALPASVALAVLALPTTAVLFGRGAFGSGDAIQTARALVWLSAGVWAVASAQPLTRMFYAYNDTRTPVLCSMLNLACFLAVSLLFMPRHGHVAIAAATSAGAVLQLALLLVLLRRRVGPLGLSRVAQSGLRAAAASAVMGLVIRDVATLGRWERGGNDLANIATFVGTVGFGLAVYVGASYLLRAEELRTLLRAIRR